MGQAIEQNAVYQNIITFNDESTPLYMDVEGGEDESPTSAPS